MKKNLLILLILISKNSFAQDLIVTNLGDSINCKITKSKGPFVLYDITTNNTTSSIAINSNTIRKIEKNYFQKNVEIEKESDLVLNIGYNKSTLTKYYKKQNIEVYDNYFINLTNGRTFHSDLTYWTFKRYGVRISYDNFNSSTNEDSMPININGTINYFHFQEELTIHSISPGICFRTPIYNPKNNLILAASYEYNFYFNPYYVDKDNAEVQSNSSGVNFCAALERKVNTHFNIGLNFKYRFSKLKDINFVYSGSSNNYILDEEDKLVINRYDIGISIGIK